LGGGAGDEGGVFVGIVVGDFVVVLVDVDHAAGAEGLAHLGTELGCCEEGGSDELAVLDGSAGFQMLRRLLGLTHVNDRCERL